MHRLLGLALLLLSMAGGTSADGQVPEDPVYYAADGSVTLFVRPDSSKPYVELELGEPVHLLDKEGRWLRVRTLDGSRGYLAAGAVSNVWIRVNKRRQVVEVYRGTRLLRSMPADFSANTFSDKEQRGSNLTPDHWRTPEGAFFVIDKNPASQFYRALVLNYPRASDAHRGLRKGIISREEYEAIVEAEETRSRPPMNTSLGGLIEIHGHGSGRRTNWTKGCVAVQDHHMNELWRWARLGTPVLVE